MATVVKDLATVNTELQEQKKRADAADFKMVTFSLAGKDYGVDIMNVKEIAKADKFTFVPNAEAFIKGVYNLRGDIIPVIDLRAFFHMPSEKKSDGQENMLILRIDERVYGTIVDKIDKVVGISKSTIQPPHPIFGDINIKYISGVVEKNGDLYVILDVLRIFSAKKQEETAKPVAAGALANNIPTSQPQIQVPPVLQNAPPPRVSTPSPKDAPSSPKTVLNEANLGAIKDSLYALKHFTACPLNDAWLRKRGTEWISTHTSAQIPPKTAVEAEEFLSSFTSPDAEKFWSDEYAEAVKSILPKLSSNNVQVWNIGCGKGYETFSFACILKSRYPNGNLKIWANDNDIMSISIAPNITFESTEVPEFCKSFITKGRNGYTFNQTIRDSIVFEYHDISHDNTLPNIDIILVRDTLSYFESAMQKTLIDSFGDILKKDGIVILGKNERLDSDRWQFIGNDIVSMSVRT